MKPKVYVTYRIPEEPLALLKEKCEVIINDMDRFLTKKELCRNLKGMDGVICMFSDRINMEVIDCIQGVKVLANYAVGYNNIDYEYAASKGIAVTNTPGVLTNATADLAWGLLLRESDFVSIHVPLTSETKHMLGMNEFKMMKRSAVLINTSRGAVLDEKALVEALKKGYIWGAGLDVYENEPGIESGLFELENVVLTPHIGSSTTETREKMAEIAVKNVLDALNGNMPPNIVN